MENKVLETSKKFWQVIEQADEAGMRAIADPECNFVHIGISCKLDQEIEFYTSGAQFLSLKNVTNEVFVTF